jgi:hypothetical protein
MHKKKSGKGKPKTGSGKGNGDTTGEKNKFYDNEDAASGTATDSEISNSGFYGID